ncbi:MAG: DNA mismatch repair protein MutS [Lewinellaceae bacterium]|nr:DNA mismatch repair protein MutS [Lewinellaceae bacterium]
MAKQTPLMGQYFKMKSQHPDAILLFRVGDFYETFGEDAVKAAEILGIVLTSRNNGGSDVELAGFPFHSLDVYLPKLVRAGYRVAICEQLEKPSKEKKIVKRGVTDIVTPGITIDETLLDRKSNNYLASIYFGNKGLGIAFLDISTGEFLISEGTIEQVEKLIDGFSPSEILFPKSFKAQYEKIFGERYYYYNIEEWIYTEEFARDQLLDHFKVQNLKGFGVEEMVFGQIAAGAILYYLSTTQNDKLSHINRINRIQNEDYVWLDRFTIRNLELVHSVHETGKPLLSVLDQTVSPMGSRMLKKWTLLPLISTDKIKSRHDMIQYLFGDSELLSEIEHQLKQIGDLERLISKVSMEKINPREIIQLKKALKAIGPVKEMLKQTGQSSFCTLSDHLNPCETIITLIESAINDDPPTLLSKGNVIKEDYDESLQDLRNTIRNSKELLLEIQQNEASRTGISSLKIGFNNVFGYYLEVTNKYKNQDLIPDDWVRKQTLSNGERYVTDELKKLETKILNAEENIADIESRLYAEIILKIAEYLEPIQLNAKAVATIDCILSLAKVAIRNNFCKPVINDSTLIDIKQGRHPVIESQLPLGESYIPNDILLDNEDTQIMMITGPNMSGKSAVLRQTALICIMAQMGSFVPAQSATIGTIDKVFTRVGASDNISSGESTFMLEMNETASIMNNISERSLILLDEIGRGTSTYDGISIAWALSEFLHNNGKANPKTLFATHYHELNELAEKYPRIKNYHISTAESGNKVIFLRKLTEGGSNHSFGIHVAAMAGMPKEIIARASEILIELETKHINDAEENFTLKQTMKSINQQPGYQLSLFESAPDPIAGKIKTDLQTLNINAMTPIECMMKLNELKKMLEE